MKNTNQQGFTVVEALIIIFIIAVLGGIGWFVWNKQNDSAAPKSNNTQATNTNKPSKSKTKTMPVGFRTYTSSEGAFSFAYPSGWGDLEQAADQSGLTAKTPQFPDNGYAFNESRLSPYFAYDVQPKDGATITIKYGPTMKSQVQNGKVTWLITDVNPADTTHKIGDLYKPECFTSSANIVMCDFSFADEGTYYGRWIFTSGDKLITVTMPNIWATSGESMPKAVPDTDLTAYKDLMKSIQETVTLN